jgi:hypothetical protein
VLLVTLLVAAESADADQTSTNPPATLFQHVNVVPMDRERVLENQYVLVVGGIIRSMGKHVEAPAGVHVVDGFGTQYLSPGLADMHEHSTTSRDMLVLLANGVTTVLNMGGATTSFVDQVVPRLNRGELPGPHVYLSLRVDGTPEYGELVVVSPEQARAVVELAKVNGYDFIKVYNNLSPAVFEAAARHASAHQGVHGLRLSQARRPRKSYSAVSGTTQSMS